MAFWGHENAKFLKWKFLIMVPHCLCINYVKGDVMCMLQSIGMCESVARAEILN